MINITHVGLVKIHNNTIQGVQYVESKWERELGDTMKIDGESWKVGIIGEDRDSVIEALNTIIKKQNSIVRKNNSIEDKKFNQYWNGIMKETITEINNY